MGTMSYNINEGEGETPLPVFIKYSFTGFKFPIERVFDKMTDCRQNLPAHNSRKLSLNYLRLKRRMEYGASGA